MSQLMMPPNTARFEDCRCIARRPRRAPEPRKERRGHGGGRLRVFKQFAWDEAGSGALARLVPSTSG